MVHHQAYSIRQAMNRKWSLVFYILQFLWSIWIAIDAWGMNEKDLNGFNLSLMILAFGLMTYWAWSIYRIVKPKVGKELNYVVEVDKNGGWWVGIDTPAYGPFASRDIAFDWVRTDLKQNFTSK
jgi:hypothetical protein